MEKNTWKIISGICLALFILQTFLVAYIFNVGTDIIDNENECSINICGDDKYDAYYFDPYENVCYCYTDHVITHQEYIGK